MIDTNVHVVHYSPYVPDIVVANDKTDDAGLVTCEACRQTLRECAEDKPGKKKKT